MIGMDYARPKLDQFFSQFADREITVVSGGAHGADAIGEQYAKDRGYHVDRMTANWSKYGKGAGYVRNQEMADSSDALIAFWDGKSKGTQHMITLAKERDLIISVRRYRIE